MKNTLILALFVIFTMASLEAKKSFNCQEDADTYLDEHYNLGCEYYNNQSWKRASNEFEKVIYFFSCTEDAAKASYYLAVCYYEMKEYDFSNEEFSNYLKASQHPEFFEDAVYYKFCIAEHFKGGKRRRPFKMRYLPKWISAQDSALEIYDEVIAALPNHELTICALCSKAELLRSLEEYRESIETYQTLIRRFPKNEIVPDCYLQIAKIYLEQSEYEYQNPDILALAELNVRKFRDQFPRDERVLIAEQTVSEIKELYAKGLCDLALFYGRLKKPEASAIYFQSAIEEFPDTKVAKFCSYRLKCLGYGQQEEICAEQPAQEICAEPEEIPPIDRQAEMDILPNCYQEMEQPQPPIVDYPAEQGDCEIQEPCFQQEQAIPDRLINEPDTHCDFEQAVPQSCGETQWEEPSMQEPVSCTQWTDEPELQWGYEQAVEQVGYEQFPPQEYDQSTLAHEHPELQWGYELPAMQEYDPYYWANESSDQQWGCGQSDQKEGSEYPSQNEDGSPCYIHYSLLKKKQQNIAPQRY